MRVCILTTSFPRHIDDYVGTFVYTLAKGFVDKKISVTVVAPHEHGIPIHENRDGIEIRRFRYWIPTRFQKVAYGRGMMQNFKSSTVAFLQLPFFLVSFLFHGIKAARHADVINAHWIISGWVGSIIKIFTRTPCVVTVHGSDIRLAEHSSLWRNITSFTLHKTSATIAVSTFLQKKIQALHITPKHISVIPDAITDAGIFQNIVPLSGKPSQLVWVGRMTAKKDPMLALRIFSRLHDQFDNLRLTFAGDGVERATLEQYVEENGLSPHVTILGTVSHEKVREIFSQPCVYLSTSREEGFGLTVAEAMLSARPVVAVDNGGVNDLITSGYDGIIVPDSENLENELVNALKLIYQNEQVAQSLGKNGRDKIRGYCSHAKVMHETNALFEKITFEKHPKNKSSNIVILGGADTTNVGDEAIFAGVAEGIRKEIRHSAIYVVARKPENVSFFSDAATLQLRTPLDVYKIIKQSDVLVVGGGGIIQDYTSLSNLLFYLGFILAAKIFRKKTMCYAVGVGPITRKVSSYLIRFILGWTDSITVRDAQSRETLLRCRVPEKKVIVATDAAFNMPLTDTEMDLLPSSLPEHSPLIGVSLRPWFFKLGGILPVRKKIAGTESWLPEFTTLLKTVAAEINTQSKNLNAQFILLPFDEKQDHILFDSLMGMIEYPKQIHHLKERIPPQQMVAIINTLDAVIAMRLHAQIFSIITGTPFVAIMYSKKNRSILSEAEYLQYACEAEKCTATEIHGIFEHVWSERDRIRGHLQNVRNKFMERDKSAEQLHKLLSSQKR